MSKGPNHPDHYMRLPICGYCMNAWDMIFKRPPWNNRQGSYTPETWVNYCRVGGCDPDVWNFMEMKKPPTDDRLFHRRGSNDDRAPWRRNWPGLIRRFSEKHSRGYVSVVDATTGLKSKVVPDEFLDFGDDDPVEESGDLVVVSDDELEW